MIHWVIDDDETYSARKGQGAKGVFNLIVGSLGEKGWDWHVWDVFGQMQQQYGLANTLCVRWSLETGQVVKRESRP